MSGIENFLIVFDYSKNEPISWLDFGADVDRATNTYADLERLHRNSHAIDIVLVGSDSIETVRMTHSNYFANGSRDLVERLLEPLS